MILVQLNGRDHPSVYLGLVIAVVLAVRVRPAPRIARLLAVPAVVGTVVLGMNYQVHHTWRHHESFPGIPSCATLHGVLQPDSTYNRDLVLSALNPVSNEVPATAYLQFAFDMLDAYRRKHGHLPEHFLEAVPLRDGVSVVDAAWIGFHLRFTVRQHTNPPLADAPLLDVWFLGPDGTNNTCDDHVASFWLPLLVPVRDNR